MSKPLGIGIVGSGFNARFHIQAFQAVRDAEVRGIYSPTRERAESAAAYARSLDVGAAQVYASIGDMVADPAIDAIWLNAPNHARLDNIEEIVHTVESGRGTLRGVACEKPLGRNLAEARALLALVERAGLPHGYLENQVFAPHLTRGKQLLWARGAATTGRPYLARAAEEHSGPHMPWFWQGQLQGGGVLNDMMCHSALVIRHLLTEPGAALNSSVHSVCTESATINRGCIAAACSRMRSMPVSASACTPSSGRPRRAPRPATCASDSSPVT